MALTSWLKAALNFKSQGGSSKNKGKSALVADQRDLAIKLKNAFESLEKELSEISQSIRECDDDYEKMERIMSRQEHLRGILNRVRAGFKRTADLERELSEWQSLLSAGNSNRAQEEKCEILESELELRGISRRTLTPEPLTLNPPPTFVTVEVSDAPEEEVQEEVSAPAVVLSLDESSFDQESAEHLEMQPEALLAGIKHVSEEMAKWQEFNANDSENLATLHELRALHAALRSLDKKQGYSRDRIAATHGFSKIFQSID